MNARNQTILAAIRAGVKRSEIAKDHGITITRVGQIARTDHGLPKTLEQLPGTDGLTAQTRGLLYRMGYRSAAEVLADVMSGKISFGCAFGMGLSRFQEIESWAARQSNPSEWNVMNQKATTSSSANAQRRAAPIDSLLKIKISDCLYRAMEPAMKVAASRRDCSGANVIDSLYQKISMATWRRTGTIVLLDVLEVRELHERAHSQILVAKECMEDNRPYWRGQLRAWRALLGQINAKTGWEDEIQRTARLRRNQRQSTKPAGLVEPKIAKGATLDASH